MYRAEFSKILFLLHKDLGSLNYILHMFFTPDDACLERKCAKYI